MEQERIRKYARLAIRRGVNVQKGQPLVIRAALEQAEFVRLCVQEAYEAGASYVEVQWQDDALSRMNYQYQSEETLTSIPAWIHDREEQWQKDGCCLLSIESSAPDAMAGIDPKKIQMHSAAAGEALRDLDTYYNNNHGQWCVIGMPSSSWAQEVFPGLPAQEAKEKLLDAILKVSRVDDHDPMENWEKHDAELIAHAEKLTAMQLQALHFTTELGTDLTVNLVKNHIWVGGGDRNDKGVYFDCNIPTEEVFCMPDRVNVNGVVYASRPLSYRGSLIENFWFRFENGKVVEYGAEKNADVLEQMLDYDEGSRYLGEVALVPYDSPISQMHLLFCNTLYDENAACHLALGQCYPENIEGGIEMSREELKAHGGNSSLQHNDFMFGTKEMSVDGIWESGEIVPVFRHGNFCL